MGAKSAKKGSGPTMAERADIHELYEQSVQNVENEIRVSCRRPFKSLSGRTAHLLREDFCGTASSRANGFDRARVSADWR